MTSATSCTTNREQRTVTLVWSRLLCCHIKGGENVSLHVINDLLRSAAEHKITNDTTEYVKYLARISVIDRYCITFQIKWTLSYLKTSGQVHCPLERVC